MGCQCHFIVNIMVHDPNIAVITYNQYDHEDGHGWPCHGKDNTLSDDVTQIKPRLSKDMISYLESCYFLQLPIESLCKMHIKKYLEIYATSRDRDFFLCKKDVVNIYNRLMKESYQLHNKDEMSVNISYQRNQDDFFLYVLYKKSQLEVQEKNSFLNKKSCPSKVLAFSQ